MRWSDIFRKGQKKKPAKVSPLLEKQYNEQKKASTARLSFDSDKLNKILDDLKSRFKKPIAKSGQVGVTLQDHVLAVAYMQFADKQPQLQFCEFSTAGDHKAAQKNLTGLVEEYGLENVDCNFVLSARDYKLLLIEAPAVEEAELADAARWKIKDMVDKPVEELVISVFRVPDDAYRVNREMLYVVAADRQHVEQVAQMVFESGLKLKSIDIPELSMLNILEMQQESDPNGVAMVDLRMHGSLMSLCKNNALYLTRHLNTQVGDDITDSIDWDAVKERLVLEIQRSLDYYESQMGQGHVSKILLVPRKQDSQLMLAELSEAMGLQIQELNLSALDSAQGLTGEQQSSCFIAISGALREEAA